MRCPSVLLSAAFVLGLAGTAHAQATDCAHTKTPLPGPNDRAAIAFVLDPQPSNIVEANSVAPHCRITPTVQSFLNELVALKNQPIFTLHIISHGVVGKGHLTDEGVLIFAQGQARKPTLTQLAQQVKGVLPNGLDMNQVSFRGCRIGAASKASLEAIRTALGASAAWATNCRTVVMSAGPLILLPANRNIRARSDLRNPQEEAWFDTEFQKFVTGDFKDVTGRSVSDCIVGLNANQSASSHVDKLEDIYFANGGELAAVWTNACQSSGPQCLPFTPPSSKCFIRLKRDQGTCRAVRVPN